MRGAGVCGRGQRRNVAFALLAIGAALAVVPAAAARRAATGRAAKPTPAISDAAVLVRFRTGVGAAAKAEAAAAHGLALGKEIAHTSFTVVRTNGRRVADSLAALRKDPRVAQVEPDYIRHAFQIPNDPYYASDQAAYLQTVRAPQAWDVTHGSSAITIAVVDTGVDSTQPDLSGRVLPGYDFANGDADAADDHWHGTFVAGVAAATGNNGTGVAGVAWSAQILPVKVLDQYGSGDDIAVAQGIVWAADHGASVINLSLGGPADSDVLRQALTYAGSKNAVVVAAAGNGGSADPSYPAADPGVVAVSATDTAGTFAYFSSYGLDVALAAPGVSIMSTMPGGAYAHGDGTSFAAPLVSGAAALVRSLHPGWTASQVVSQLESTAHDVGAPGRDPYYGYGVLDLDAAVGATPQAAGTSAGDGLEPDDTMAQAAAVPSPVDATIGPEGDVDWYRVAVASPGLLAANVDQQLAPGTAGTSPGASVSIYDSANNLLQRVDGASVRTAVVAQALAAGTYYIRVAADTGGETRFGYTLRWTRLPFYAPRALATPQPAADLAVTGINGSGTAVGWYSPMYSGKYIGAVWRNGVESDFTTGMAAGIDDAGDIAYEVQEPSSSPCGYYECAFVDRSGTQTPLAPLVQISDMRAGGNILGYTWDAASSTKRVGRWSNGTLTTLPTTQLPFAGGVNDLGDAAGGDGNDAVLWRNGGESRLGGLAPGCPSLGLGLNGSDAVVGLSQLAPAWSGESCGIEQAVVWRNGVITDLGPLPDGDSTRATAIAGDGTIAGYGHGSDDADHAFVDVDQVMVPLDAIVPPGWGWYFESAPAVNADGVIAGVGYRNGALVGYTLTPSTTPPTPSEPPANDNFARAIVLDRYWRGAWAGTAVADTTAATRESGEPTILGNPGGHSVWFSWTPQYSGTATFDMTNSSFDTMLAVYTGDALASLQLVAANDDADGSRISKLTVPVHAGLTYRLQIDGHNGTSDPPWFGSAVLNWSLQSNGGPANDEFSNAGVLPVGTSSTAVDNRGATKEPGEPDHAGNPGGHSVWYSWTPDRSGQIVIATGQSPTGFDTLLAVYTGTRVDALTPVASNDDSAPGTGSGDSAVSFYIDAGRTYMIAVDGKDGAVGTTALEFSSILSEDSGPVPNDSFQDPRWLTGTGGSVSGSNVGATKQTGEPNHAGNAGGASVWFRWTAPASGSVTLDTAGSGFNTLLAVYDGSSWSMPIASNDDAHAGTTTSAVTFDATQGSAYAIAVDGFRPSGGTAATGTYVLNWREGSPPASGGPANDDFVDATVLSGASGSVSGTTAGATLEYAEPKILGYAGGHSVWFRWTASSSGPVTVDTSGSSFDTLLAAYFGSFVGGLTKLGENDNSGGAVTSTVTFSAVAGVSYSFQLDGRSNAAGAYVLHWTRAGSSTGGTTNLLSNGSFESDLSGWAGNGATLSQASDGTVGSKAALVSITNSTALMYANPRPATSTSAGTVYSYNGWLRSATPGRTVCLRLREYTSAGTLLGAKESCATATSSWAQFPTLSYTAAASGSSFAVHAYEQNAAAGDSFELDGLTLTAGSASADTTPPETTITSGPSGTVGSTSASFSFTSSEPGSSFQCQLDNSAWTTCSSPQTYTNLTATSHSFAVRATDPADNTDPTPATANWTIQTTAPANLVSNGSFEGTLNGWGASDGGTLSLTSGGQSGTQAARITAGSGATTPMLYATPRPVSSTTQGVTYTLQAWIRSSAGLNVCERIREWSSSGTLLGEKIVCAAATSSWQQLAPAALTATSSGSTIAIQIYGTSASVGQSFDVDTVTLTSA